MSQSKLSSLLKYRFIKRPSSTTSSQSSDDSTQPPSETSTQPPVTPDKGVYASCPVTPTQQLTPNRPKPFSLPVTPSQGSNASTIPETSSMSSPDSPVFGTKPKLINKNWGPPPEESPASSPWLSKENGALMNGVASSTKKKKKKARQYPEFSDEDSDSDVCIIEDYDNKLSSLKQMFPSKGDVEIRKALLDVKGDQESAFDVLMGAGTGRFKRIRTQHEESTDSENGVSKQPRKRLRQMSSDSDDDVVVLDREDSAATLPYSLDSQRSDATEIYNLGSPKKSVSLTDDPEKLRKIDFLATCFPGKTKLEIQEALSACNWNEGDAVAFIDSDTAPPSVSKKPSIPHTISAKDTRSKGPADDKGDIDLCDEDEEYGSGNESGDSDDSIEEEGEEAKTVKEVIVSFFNDASVEELMTLPGCSKKKSEIIFSSRPFDGWESLVLKFTTTKGLSYEMISGCKEVIKMREVVIRLMQRCEKISSGMEEVVNNLLHSSTELEDGDQITKQPSNLNQNFQLKPFQMVGLNWLKIMHTQDLNGILADEMGLGKTIQTISFLAHLLEEGEPGPHVIIVPSSTIENWIRESKTWCPSLKLLVYYGSQEDRRATRQYIMMNDADQFNVVLTTYNMATGSIEDRSLFKKFSFHYAVFDEGHLLKNMSSLRYQNLMRISAERRLLLTGTPLQNNLLELMSLLCFVMPEVFMGKTEHLKRMFTMISRQGTEETRSRYEQERIAHAKRIMKPFVLRRLKSEVLRQLPKKIEELEYCTMIQGQQELYERLIRNFANKLTDDGNELNVAGGAAMLMQLRKAANHPLLHRNHYTEVVVNKMAKALAEEPSHQARGALPKLIAEDMLVMSDFELHKCCLHYKSHLKKFLLDDSLIEGSGKFRVLEERLNMYQMQGNRVLLFSQFTTMLDIMEPFLKLKSIKFLRLDGSTPVPERQRLIDMYNNDKSILVFLLSTKAGGLGINLTSANVVILHDIDFNPYNDKQAEDRCHRVGQTQEVKVVRLISKDTVEEAMLRCGKEKLKLEQDVTSSDTQAEDDNNPKDIVSILQQALIRENISVKS